MNNLKKDFVEKLISILVQHGVFNQKEGESLKKDFSKRSKAAFEDFLLEESLVPKDKLLKALSTYYQVPSFDCVGFFFDHDLVKDFPKDFLIENSIIPLKAEEGILIFVASEPDKPGLRQKIAKFEGENVGQVEDYDIEFYVGLRQDIYDSIREFYDDSLTYVHDVQDDDEHEEEDEEKSLDIDQYIEDKEKW